MLAFVSWRALIALTEPPSLNGSPVSIVNLHRQLTSPMDVLAATLGDRPLSMNIQFDGQQEGRVTFEMRSESRYSRDDDTQTNQSLIGDISKQTISTERDTFPQGQSLVSHEELYGYRAPDPSPDEISEEEGRMIVGMQTRQEAREYQQTRVPLSLGPPVSAGRRYSWDS